MSHFSLLVITEGAEPTQETIAPLLQPWHEFECTGVDDEYVVEVDDTQRYRDDYAKDTIRMIRRPDGTLANTYEDEFYRDPTPEEQKRIGGGFGFCGGVSYDSRDWGDGRGYRAKVNFIPDGYEEVTISQSEARSFREFVVDYNEIRVVAYGTEPIIKVDGGRGDDKAIHKYHYALEEENGEIIKIVKRTNPNRKWDWWTIGGRWNGHFQPSYDPKADPENWERCTICYGTGKRMDHIGREARSQNPEYTCNGCDGKGKHLKWELVPVGNTVQRKDLPFDLLRRAAELTALADYDAKHKIVAGRELPDWDALEAAHGVEVARNLFWEHPVLRDLQEAGHHFWSRDEITFLRKSREQAAEDARNGAIATFAVVKDGQWFERGEMGWWTIVMGEKDESEWRLQLAKLIENLSPDAWLTIVDCHI